MLRKSFVLLPLAVVMAASAGQAWAIDEALYKRIQIQCGYMLEAGPAVQAEMAAMGDAGQRAFLEIAQSARYPDWIRCCAIQWLDRTRMSEALPLVRSIALDAKAPSAMRQSALEWLCVGNRDDLPFDVFAQALNTQDCDVMQTALRALERARDTPEARARASEAVRNLLQSGNYPKECFLSIVGTLGMLADEKAIPLLARAGASASEYERLNVIQALCQIGGKEGRAAAFDLYQGMQDARRKEVARKSMVEHLTWVMKSRKDAGEMEEVTALLEKLKS